VGAGLECSFSGNSSLRALVPKLNLGTQFPAKLHFANAVAHKITFEAGMGSMLGVSFSSLRAFVSSCEKKNLPLFSLFPKGVWERVAQPSGGML